MATTVIVESNRFARGSEKKARTEASKGAAELRAGAGIAEPFVGAAVRRRRFTATAEQRERGERERKHDPPQGRQAKEPGSRRFETEEEHGCLVARSEQSPGNQTDAHVGPQCAIVSSGLVTEVQYSGCSIARYSDRSDRSDR